MSQYEIVSYQPQHDEGVVALRHLSWSADPALPPRFLAWKYKQNPFIQDPILVIALHEGKVIGMRGAFGTCWEAGDATRIIIPAADDFAVLPEHRNSGAATTIMRSMHESLVGRGYRHAVALSAGRITMLQSLAMGWKSAGSMEPVACFGRRQLAVQRLSTVLRRQRGLWRLVRRNEQVLDSPTTPFERLDAAGFIKVSDGSVVTLARVPRAGEMAALIARLPWDGRIRHVRDAAYLEWRYQCPTREYRFLYLERDGRLEGYLVLARSASYRLPSLAFHIVDWEGGTAGVRATLLHTALRIGKFPAIGMWKASVQTEDHSLLASAGFANTEAKARERGLPCVLVRTLQPGVDWMLGDRNLLEQSHWDMRMLYSMHG